MRQDFHVGHFVFPGYTENAAQVERVQSLFLPGIVYPCLTPIRQCADDASIVHWHLCHDRELGVLPTRVVRWASVVADFPMLLSISMPRERLLLMVETKYLNWFTTASLYSSMVMAGGASIP